MTIDKHITTANEMLRVLFECRETTHNYLKSKKDDITSRLTQLRNDLLDVTEERSEAGAQGDLSENAEYHNATAKLLQLNKDIALLQDKLHAFDIYSAVMGVHKEMAPNAPAAIYVNNNEQIVCSDQAVLANVDPASELVGDRGKTVLLECDNGSSYAWTLAPNELADTDASLLSCDSPVGKRLIGQRAGFQFTIVIRGKTLLYTLKGVL